MPDRPDDDCGDRGGDHDCLWRVEGYSINKARYVKFVGLVRAPTRDVALVLAIARYGRTHRDLSIRGDPLSDRDFVPSK